MAKSREQEGKLKEGQFRWPSARQAALLVVYLITKTASEFDRDITRVRLSEQTMRALWGGRTRVSTEDFTEMQEYLLQARWVLFWMGDGYAVIKLDAVEGWPRIAPKRIAPDLEKVAAGRYEFEVLEKKLWANNDE